MCGCGAVWDTWYPSIPDIIVYGEHCNIQASQNGGGTLRIFFCRDTYHQACVEGSLCLVLDSWEIILKEPLRLPREQ
jgi:hypothetical protein